MTNLARQDVVVFIRDKKTNRLLLARKKRSLGIGKLNGPGGKIEAGETPEQAMVRECQEEIGVTPVKFHKGAELTLHEFHDGETFFIFAHVYICDGWQGTPQESEEMAPEWVPLDAIPYDNMWADDPYWLPRILDGETLKCEFWLNEDDEVIKHTVDAVDAF